MYDEFPWIKFTILTVLLIVPIVMMAPSMKWKLIFALSVPIGVVLALNGRSIGRKH